MTAGRTAAIVGIGHSAFGKRGAFTDIGVVHLALEAIRNAVDDAGLRLEDVDGFTSWFEDQALPSELLRSLPVQELRYSAMTWGGTGSGLPTAIQSAVLAVETGIASHVVVLRSVVQGRQRMGASVASRPMPASWDAIMPFGFTVPTLLYALRIRRHMAEYGTTTEHLGHVAVQTRAFAAANPAAVMRQPITMEDHSGARLIADPLRLFDCCLESDGAAAFVVTTLERARHLRHPAVVIGGISTLAEVRRPNPTSFLEDTDLIASAGHRRCAADLYGRTGLGPGDIDVALLYDGTTAGVLLSLEDWGFCPRGESGSFVADGGTALGGTTPVNTHGGNLSEVYLQGITHVLEAVRQLRGTAANQVPGASTALYASGVGFAPGGGVVFRRDD